MSWIGLRIRFHHSQKNWIWIRILPSFDLRIFWLLFSLGMVNMNDALIYYSLVINIATNSNFRGIYIVMLRPDPQLRRSEEIFKKNIPSEYCHSFSVQFQPAELTRRFHILPQTCTASALAHVSCSLKQMYYRFAVIFGQPCKMTQF